MLGAHGFALTASYHPSLENNTSTTVYLRAYLSEAIRRKYFSERSTQVRSNRPVATLLVTVVPPDDLAENLFTRTVSLRETRTLEKLNNEGATGREQPNTRNENVLPTRSRRFSNNNISTSFQPISMIQKPTVSSQDGE